MPDITEKPKPKPKLDERRVWSVANDRRPALLQLLDEAGYEIEEKGKPEAEPEPEAA